MTNACTGMAGWARFSWFQCLVVSAAGKPPLVRCGAAPSCGVKVPAHSVPCAGCELEVTASPRGGVESNEKNLCGRKDK